MMKKILLVYHSRSGNTSTIARKIASSCHADLESVKDVRRRSVGVSYVRAAFEAFFHQETAIESTRYDPADYDLVIIATPVWSRNIASPIRTYIKNNRHLFKNVGFFCTYGNSGEAKVLRDLEKLTGKPAFASTAITNSDIRRERSDQKTAEFIAKILNNDTGSEIETHSRFRLVRSQSGMLSNQS